MELDIDNDALDSAVLAKDSVVVALRNNVTGLLRRRTNDYEYSTYHVNAHYPFFMGDNNTSLLLQRGPTPTSQGNSALVQGFDNNWDSIYIQITGMNTDASIDLDVVYCLEFLPVPASGVYTFATASPPRNDRVLARAENIAQKAPLATPGTATDWAATVANVAKVGATIASFA